MARTPFRDIQEVATTSLAAYYTVGVGLRSVLSVVRLINTTSSALNIKVYKNDGTTDFIIDELHLPGGEGRARQVYGLGRAVLHAGDSLKFQADAATAWNLDIDGSEVEI